MILIVGAGLSGLLTAYLLKKEGIPFKILEARNRPGGRINTLYGTNQAPVEVGATWFTHEHKYLIRLLNELNIEYFEQSMDTTVFYEPSTIAPAQLVQIPKQVPSFRISGGSSSLVNALIDKLDETDVLFNQAVNQIKSHTNTIEAHTSEKVFIGNAIVLAIPPKLWAKNMVFTPHLPADLLSIALQTQTWMEDSIKIALTYKQPFWGQGSLPGTLFSNVGPINEFYDHSNHERSKYALCGFLDSSLKNLSYAERRDDVIKQIKSVFGVQAEDFTSYEECIWSKENNTFTASETILSPHQNNGNPIFHSPVFDNKLFISSTESSAEFPGYMEGALHSANMTVGKLIKVPY
jgi:monoamine oxidase